ncbi:hypothetical protein [Pseudomonas frederiksbergensis]|uniref:hypothetical protein n=1 Tax=Pseudomonas frederiksbergensis TaxID=104087 RepID=UPI00157CC095|nr:hypothetical protein [Pseudomonas frederiksbergensis]
MILRPLCPDAAQTDAASRARQLLRAQPCSCRRFGPRSDNLFVFLYAIGPLTFSNIVCLIVEGGALDWSLTTNPLRVKNHERFALLCRSPCCSTLTVSTSVFAHEAAGHQEKVTVLQDQVLLNTGLSLFSTQPFIRLTASRQYRATVFRYQLMPRPLFCKFARREPLRTMEIL